MIRIKKNEFDRLAELINDKNISVNLKSDYYEIILPEDIDEQYIFDLGRNFDKKQSGVQKPVTSKKLIHIPAKATRLYYIIAFTFILFIIISSVYSNIQNIDNQLKTLKKTTINTDSLKILFDQENLINTLDTFPLPESRR